MQQASRETNTSPLARSSVFGGHDPPPRPVRFSLTSGHLACIGAFPACLPFHWNQKRMSLESGEGPRPRSCWPPPESAALFRDREAVQYTQMALKVSRSEYDKLSIPLGSEYSWWKGGVMRLEPPSDASPGVLNDPRRPSPKMSPMTRAPNLSPEVAPSRLEPRPISQTTVSPYQADFCDFM
jgi:hypothetical protein